LAAPNIARAAPVELVLGTNGGDEYKATYEAVYGPFEKKYNAKIVPVFADGSTLLNRALAEKNNPSMDATVTYQGAWLVGQAEGVFAKVDYSRIPYIDDVYDFMLDPKGYAPFANFAAWGLVYNADVIKQPPVSLKDLWLPAFKDQTMIGGVYHWGVHLTAFAYAWTGDQTKIDVAFDKVRELAPRLAGFYGLTSDTQSKFQQGLANIATWYSSYSQRLRNLGMPITYVTPAEGSFLSQTNYQAIEGSKKIDLVEKLIGQFFDPECSVNLARLNGQIPPNRKVKLDAELQKQILTTEQIQQCHNWDWELIVAQQDAWLTRWNAEIRPLLQPH